MGLPRRHTDGLYTGNVFGELVNLIEKAQMSAWSSHLEGNKKNKIKIKSHLLRCILGDMEVCTCNEHHCTSG